MKHQHGASLVLKYGILIVLTVVFLFPFAWMITTSLKTNAEVLSNPTAFFP
ncbi:MAG: carbohydrate ABC transporter permease, partial [Chloroflexi bacterium]|nr:carbohydrate ABC transporter permease [Chloroflexota bacterium]